MNTQDERKVFESLPEITRIISSDEIKWCDVYNWYRTDNTDANSIYHLAWLNGAWWSHQAQAKKLEGCVVVQKDQIETWWQDAEEPENFATKDDDLPFIAQHIQDDEIMEINEHHTIHLPSVTKFGAWVYRNGQRKFIVGTKDDVEAARGGNEN